MADQDLLSLDDWLLWFERCETNYLRVPDALADLPRQRAAARALLAALEGDVIMGELIGRGMPTTIAQQAVAMMMDDLARAAEALREALQFRADTNAG